MTGVAIESLQVRFGETEVLRGLDLEIAEGEFFFLLGPSGCGKTTLLRTIAGFVEPVAGRVRFGERDVTRTPPAKRDCGMVFQNYALWPHMTVGENVRFGLDVRKLPAEEKRRKVAEALRLVRMEGFEDRTPGRLSGGQQQRVALARALVVDPAVLLLDEPLSNLDAKLRVELRAEIRDIQRRTGRTAIYVTHDRAEALALADRIAVLRAGRIEQVGTPEEIYDRPRSAFVAGFVGDANRLSGRSAGREGDEVLVEGPFGRVRARAPAGAPAEGTEVELLLRPERLRIGAAAEHDGLRGRIAGRLLRRTFLGEVTQYEVEVSGGSLRVLRLGRGEHLDEGSEAPIGVEDALVFPAGGAASGA